MPQAKFEGGEPVQRKDWKEHLREGIEPIRLCVMNNEDKPNEEMERIRAHGRWIGYYSHPGFRHTTRSRDFFFTEVDERDKYSTDYRNCSGVAVVGYDPALKKQISFITHQRPDVLLSDKKQRTEFETELRQKLRELKTRSETGTVDAVTFGGSYSSDFSRDRDYQTLFNMFRTFAGDYKRIGKIISTIIHEELGFYADTIQGPNLVKGAARIDLGTQTRHLYSQRPRQPEESGADMPFNSKDLKKAAKKWPKRFLLDEKGR
jgi:hypothetical protein